MLKKITLVIGIILLVLFVRRISIDDLRNVQFVSLKFVVGMILVNSLVLGLKTWRWRVLLSQFDIRLPTLGIFRSVSSGFYLGLVSPGTAGEFARILRLPIQKQYGLSTIALEKVADIAVLFYLSIVGLAFLFFPGAHISLSLTVPLLFIGSVFFVAIRASRTSNKITKLLMKKFKLDEAQLENIILTLRKTHVVFLCIFVSLILWIIPGVQYYMICKAINIDITFQTLIISLYGPYLLGVISMIPLGFGIFDLGTSQMLYKSLSGGRDLANISVVLFRLLTTLPLVLFGFVCFLFTMLRKNSTELT